MTTIAVTGHRPDKLGGYGKGVIRRLVTLAEQFITELQPEEVITGMALGWDQAVAEACRRTNTPFIAAVPFKGQELRWPRESQAYYRELLSCAKRVEYVCSPGYSAAKMQRRNEWMVCRAEQVIALWDGTNGGTGNCVAYAIELGVDITNLWPRWLELNNQGEDL